MATSYQKADENVLEVLDTAMGNWHRNLRLAGVKVGVLMAYNPDGDAVKHGGYPALATVKVVSLKDRVTKEIDAEVLIDEAAWRELHAEQRLSCLDHELQHLNLVPLSPKELQTAQQYDPQAPWWKLDDLGRPRLRTVPGDWNAGDGFKAVVERHGHMAIEFHNLTMAKGKADIARKKGEDERAASGEDAA